MPPAAAAATCPWMLVRFAVGRVRTSPCWPPSCPAMLKGVRMGWFRAGVPPGTTPATAEANCWAVSNGCNKSQTASLVYCAWLSATHLLSLLAWDPFVFHYRHALLPIS